MSSQGGSEASENSPLMDSGQGSYEELASNNLDKNPNILTSFDNERILVSAAMASSLSIRCLSGVKALHSYRAQVCLGNFC